MHSSLFEILGTTDIYSYDIYVQNKNFSMKGQNISFVANLYISAGKYGVGNYILLDCGSELSRHFTGFLPCIIAIFFGHSTVNIFDIFAEGLR
jgi:hypothetical protein